MRFIHLSDLHFNPGVDGRASRDLREGLISYLTNLNTRADDLIITGDFRHAKFQGKDKNEIDELTTYIWKIANAVHIASTEHIHIVPGNHDKDRQKNDTRKFAQIRKTYDVNRGTFVNSDLEYFKSQFEYFFLVCNSLYGQDNFWGKSQLHTYRVVNRIVFLYLNSAILHNSSLDRGRLIVGNDYLERLLNEINTKYADLPIIVLAHHSPDCFEKKEKETVEEILRRYPMVKLYLCGDSHETWIRKVNEHYEITMGCITQEQNVEETFMIGDTDFPEFTVHHWVKAWEPYRFFNEYLEQYFPKCKDLNDNEIREDQDRLKSDVILPWMRNSPAIGALFPKLFVEPNYCSERLREQYTSFSDIINMHNNANLIFTGEAGVGKTTLLRQLYLYENDDHHFLYLQAKALLESSYRLHPYQKYVRNLLLYGVGDDKGYLVFLDGIDEVYIDDTENLSELICSIDKLQKTHVWFGWRQEHLTQNETETLRQMTRDTISLSAWKQDKAKRYVEKYSKAIKNPSIIDDYNDLVSKDNTICSFTESPFRLSLLVWLIENKNTDPLVASFFTKEQTIYHLYNTFFQCWIKKEHDRKTSILPDDDIRQMLWDISYKLYYSPTCEVVTKDTAVSGLLSFSGVGAHIANGFFHRSFCAFFVADKIFNAVKAGDVELIDALRKPLKNDVTDFIRSAISGCESEDISVIQRNLINAYHQIDNPDKHILSTRAKDLIEYLNKKDVFILKNELIYLATRITDSTNIIPEFLKEIHKSNIDPYILLDIAYAATLTGPTEIALAYAKSLEPGSQNDLINRSWSMAYFGDVQTNPHEYRDIEKAPWTKAREARMRRFQRSDRKALRFRILDLPLLYCYYFDREWKDANESDYIIIKNVDIENDSFSEEEKQFMRQKKEQLLRGFQNHLYSSSE